MANFLFAHPSLFLFLLPAIPSLIGKLEKIIIKKLLSDRDEIDRRLIKSVIKSVVIWAEEKGARDGAAKFAAADRLVARALPFLNADQRKALIENAVLELDKTANEVLQDPRP